MLRPLKPSPPARPSRRSSAVKPKDKEKDDVGHRFAVEAGRVTRACGATNQIDLRQSDTLGVSRTVVIVATGGPGLAPSSSSTFADHEVVLTLDDGQWPAAFGVEDMADECTPGGVL
jgi:hypothetical protein